MKRSAATEERDSIAAASASFEAGWKTGVVEGAAMWREQFRRAREEGGDTEENARKAADEVLRKRFGQRFDDECRARPGEESSR
jgi:hypothetical protein